MRQRRPKHRLEADPGAGFLVLRPVFDDCLIERDMQDKTAVKYHCHLNL
jgi:hypothetical protein